MSKDRWPAAEPKIAAAMRRVRKAEGVTQAELARRLECSQQFISQVEHNQVPITPRCIVKVAGALRVPATRIYEESRRKP